MKNIEESRGARLGVNRDRFRALSGRTKALMRRDKEGYVKNFA